jgi:hypothetical protein
VILAEIACIGIHLIDVALLGKLPPLELDHIGFRAGKEDDVWAAAPFARELVLEHEPPAANARPLFDEFLAFALEDSDGVGPGANLAVTEREVQVVD